MNKLLAHITKIGIYFKLRNFFLNCTFLQLRLHKITSIFKVLPSSKQSSSLGEPCNDFTYRVSIAKFRTKGTKNKTFVSYSQNLSEVCADYTCSLYKLRLKFVQTSAEVSRKYYVLINLSTHTYLFN